MMNVDMEFDDKAVHLILPPCLPDEMVLDLLEFLGCSMAPFQPTARKNVITLIMPRAPEQHEQEQMALLLQRNCNCWFRCYTRKLEMERQGKIKAPRQHLRVVEGPII